MSNQQTTQLDKRWKPDSIFRLFFVSASASGIAATSVYPFDLIKTRIQNQRKLLNLATTNVSGTSGQISTKIYKNSWECFLDVVKKEGFLGLYRGLNVNLLGQVPEKAIRLVLVDTIRRTFGSKPEKPLYVAELAAGMAAGTMQVMITNPMEIIKVRLQVAGANSETGIVSIARQLGFGGIYRGASACFARDIPFSGIYFPTYAYMKELLKGKNDTNSTFNLFIAGSIAGVAATTIATPPDVVKTRLQVEVPAGVTPYKGLFSTFWRIYSEEGFGALWKGLGPRMLRSSPQYGVMLLSFEVLQGLILNDKKIEQPVLYQLPLLNSEQSWLNDSPQTDRLKQEAFRKMILPTSGKATI